MTTGSPETIQRLLRAARPMVDAPRRVPLGLSSGIRTLPGQVAEASARTQLVVSPDRLLLRDPEDWRVLDLRADEALLAPEDHLALRAGTSSDLYVHLPRQTLHRTSRVTLRAEYTGDRAEGGLLLGCLFCVEGPGPRSRPRLGLVEAPSPDADLAKEIVRVRTSSSRVQPNETVELLAAAQTSEFYPRDLLVEDAHHWVVNDVRLDGETLLVQAGDLPGELFSDRPERLPIRAGRLSVDGRFVVAATYVGPDEGAVLSYEVSGPRALPRNEWDAPEDSAFLPMSSGVCISPSQSVTITSRPYLPDEYGFLPEQVVLWGPEGWVVDDVKVGVRSQFACSGDVPGVAFSPRSRGTTFRMDPVPGGVDFTIGVTYVGAEQLGAPFVCGVAGRVVQLS